MTMTKGAWRNGLLAGVLCLGAWGQAAAFEAKGFGVYAARVDAPGESVPGDRLVGPDGKAYRLEAAPLLSQSMVLGVETVKNDFGGGVTFVLRLSRQGGDALEAYSQAHMLGRLAVVLDGKVLSVPMIVQPLRSGQFTFVDQDVADSPIAIAQSIMANPKSRL